MGIKKITVKCARCTKPVTRTLRISEKFENGQINNEDILCISCRQVKSWESRNDGTYVSKNKKYRGRQSFEIEEMHTEKMKESSPCRILSKEEIEELNVKYKPPKKTKKAVYI